MRPYLLLSVQAFLSDSFAQSASSLRNINAENVSQRQLLDDALFDCEKGCDMAIGGPVCGDDDISYQNQCLAFCQDVIVKSAGECSGHHSMSDATYEDVVVTKAQLDRFKDEKFVFVGKRNFMKTQGDHMVSNKNAEATDGVVCAHRMTHDWDEYVAKIDLGGIDLNRNSTTGQLPLGVENDRHLQDNNRGVVGGDNRYRVPYNEIIYYPYTAIGDFYSSSGDFGCTGTVVSKSAVLTNAHCRFKDGKFTSIDSFAPGVYRRQGQVTFPEGEWIPQYWTILSGWFSAEELKYDIAIAHFNPNMYRGSTRGDFNIGELTGYVGIEATTNDSNKLQKATVTGYPHDKPVGTMWTSGSCTFQKGYDDAITYHTCDSTVGNDGSALLNINKATAYGVDAGEVPVGPQYPGQVYVNLGVVFTDDNIDLISQLIGS